MLASANLTPRTLTPTGLFTCVREINPIHKILRIIPFDSTIDWNKHIKESPILFKSVDGSLVNSFFSNERYYGRY